MSTIGVQWGNVPNPWGQAYSVGSSLASDSNVNEINRAKTEGYLRSLGVTDDLHRKQAEYYGVKTRGEQQTIDGKNSAGEGAAAIAEYNATHPQPSQGSSNANPAGAAPVPVDLPPEVREGIKNYARGTALSATGANDLAGGTGKVFGSTGMMFGPADSATQRRNSTLYTGTAPNENTVLGPYDTAGTDARIRVEGSKPHFFEDGTSVAVPDAKEPSGYRRESLGGVDKNPNYFNGNSDQSRAFSAVDQIAQKFSRGEQLSETEKNAYELYFQKAFPRDWAKVQIGGNEYDVDRNEGLRQNFPSIDEIRSGRRRQPQNSPNDAPPQQNQPQQNAPVPIQPNGQPYQPTSSPPQEPPPGARYVGPVQKTPTESQNKAYDNIVQMANAERYLTRLNPGDVPPMPRALLSNPEARYNWQQFLSLFRTDAERRYMSAVMEFVEPELRWKSGAAISGTEWANNIARYSPAPGASQDEINRAKSTRMAAFRGIERGAFAGSPADQRAFRDQLKGWGVDLDYFDDAQPPSRARTAAPSAGARTRLDPKTGEFVEVR